MAKELNKPNFYTEGNRLIFKPELFFYNLYDDIHELDDKELKVLNRITEIEFPDGIGSVDEEVWMALADSSDEGEPCFLDNIHWVDFSQAVDLTKDLYVSYLLNLTSVVLPPNLTSLEEVNFERCPSLAEVHMHTLGTPYSITRDADRRLTLYASEVLDDFYKVFNDNEKRLAFARDVNTLVVPKSDAARITALLENEPLPDDLQLTVKPLSKSYSIPTNQASINRKTVRAAQKAAEEAEYQRRYKAAFEEVMNSIAAEDENMEDMVFMVNGVPFRMKYVRGGTFSLGHQRYDEHYDFTLHSFMMSETVITQTQWRAVMGNNPSKHKICMLFDRPNHPVEQVNPRDIDQFLVNLFCKTNTNFRLPNRAEWQYAAKGGVKAHGYRYAGSDNVDEVAWHSGNGGNTTHAVKGKKPNELGLYDMCGNVLEMCDGTIPQNYIDRPIVNPKPWEDGQIVNGCTMFTDCCGGDVMNGPESKFGDCSVEMSSGNTYRDDKDDLLGFRIICDVPKKK